MAFFNTAFIAFLLVFTSILTNNCATAQEDERVPFYDFIAKSAEGTEIHFSRYRRSKVVLVVNVASACGYTDVNYKELQELYDKYHSQGLEILAFPCNQFGAQEPNDEPEILHFLRANYQVTFPVFEKIDVNGPNAHRLFKYLKDELPGLVINDIKWNFTKFLLVNGVPFKRYATIVSPSAIESDIVEQLAATTSSSSTTATDKHQEL